jgi:hypothetical protein
MQGRLMNQGIEHIIDILGKDQAPAADTNNITFIRFGDDNSSPEDTSLTDLINPSPTYFEVGSTSRNGISPFDLEVTVILPLTDPSRPYNASEVGLYVGTVGNEILVARGTLVTPIVFPVSSAEVVTIDFVIV